MELHARTTGFTEHNPVYSVSDKFFPGPQGDVRPGGERYMIRNFSAMGLAPSRIYLREPTTCPAIAALTAILSHSLAVLQRTPTPCRQTLSHSLGGGQNDLGVRLISVSPVFCCQESRSANVKILSVIKF